MRLYTSLIRWVDIIHIIIVHHRHSSFASSSSFHWTTTSNNLYGLIGEWLYWLNVNDEWYDAWMMCWWMIWNRLVFDRCWSYILTHREHRYEFIDSHHMDEKRNRMRKMNGGEINIDWWWCGGRTHQATLLLLFCFSLSMNEWMNCSGQTSQIDTHASCSSMNLAVGLDLSHDGFNVFVAPTGSGGCLWKVVVSTGRNWITHWWEKRAKKQSDSTLITSLMMMSDVIQSPFVFFSLSLLYRPHLCLCRCM